MVLLSHQSHDNPLSRFENKNHCRPCIVGEKFTVTRNLPCGTGTSKAAVGLERSISWMTLVST